MPPYHRQESVPWTESLISPIAFIHLCKVILLTSVFFVALRSFLVLAKRRRSNMSSPPSPSTLQRKPDLPTPPSPEKAPSQFIDPDKYLESLKKETLDPSAGPIFPWIAPPQPLPGPYDTPYYPLPLPTIRPHSHDPEAEKTEETKTEDKPEIIPYTRRISTNSIPDHETIISGSITTSTQGWRRNYWSVTTG